MLLNELNTAWDVDKLIATEDNKLLILRFGY